MKLAILGGGGFRTPLMYDALLRDEGRPRVGEVWLHDVDSDRLDVIGHVLDGMAAEADASPRDPEPPIVHVTTDLDAAIRGADFVLCAFRVGGLDARTADERIALDHGLVAQETIGAGGLSCGLRTVPVAVDLASRVKTLAPRAHVLVFTNPAGMVTQAMQAVLGDRVIGICESPTGLVNGVVRALDLTPAQVERLSIDYIGINHLGWLRGLHLDGRDLLAELLADRTRLESLKEGRLFGADWLAATGGIPNEFAYYYDFAREAIESARSRRQTRGEFLLDQQHTFFEEITEATRAVDPDEAAPTALAIWRRVRQERKVTSQAEARADVAQTTGEERPDGYEGTAVALMAALRRGERSRLVLDVRNGATFPKLPREAVVEVPCRADAEGPTPIATEPLTGRLTGRCIQVKHAETLAIEAAATGSVSLAWQAFAAHPLVDSVGVARSLLDAYRAAIPEVDAVFTR